MTVETTYSLQSSYNLINLPAQIKSGDTVKANYTYLSDGTKAAAYTSASAGRDSDFGARFYDRTAWTAIDPMAEKYYSVSPYAYCHLNPLNRIDYDGKVDWRLIKKGAVGLGAGAGSAIAGAVITGGTVGAASPAGAIMVVDGVVGILLGTTYILTGLLTSPSKENDKLMEVGPSDVTNTFAKSSDLMMNNQHHEFEIGTDLLKIGISSGIFNDDYARLMDLLPTLKKAIVEGGSLFQSYDVLQKISDEVHRIETRNPIILELPEEEDVLFGGPDRN